MSELHHEGIDAQPLPITQEGQVEVTPIARERFNDQLTAQYEKGKKKYGQTLHTWNGRDVWRDVREESVDMIQYLTQAELEYRDLEQKVREREAEIASYIDILRQVERFVVPQMAHLGETTRRVMADVIAAINGAPRLPVLDELKALQAQIADLNEQQKLALFRIEYAENEVKVLKARESA